MTIKWLSKLKYWLLNKVYIIGKMKYEALSIEYYGKDRLVEV